MAIDVLVGNWDNYWSNMNNYYLYYEPTDKKFQWIPYDYDNTFGIDWFNIDWTTANPYNFPRLSSSVVPYLINRILAYPQYKDLYTHYLAFYAENIFKISNLSARIDSIHSLISPYVINDVYKNLDYGFTTSDFHNSYSETYYSNKHVKTGLKQFIIERYNSIVTKLNYVSSDPIVYQIRLDTKNPGPNDSIKVYTSGFAANEINSIKILFHPGALTVIYEYNMKPAPVNGTTNVEKADQWIGTIPPLGSKGYGKIQIQIIDKKGNTKIYPLNNPIDIKTTSKINSENIVINEFMADNSKTITDPAGEFEDWLELFNPSQNEISLTGLYLTDDPSKPNKCKLDQPGISIKPGEHLIVWCDENQNDNQAGIHTNFKISKSGEFLGIVAEDGVTWIDSISFGPQSGDISYGRTGDGSDYWNFMTPSPGSANLSTDVKQVKQIPEAFEVNIYPNPFNPTTNILYFLPTVSDVSISIYNAIGSVIWIHSTAGQPAGKYTIQWNGINNNGKKVASGLYICKVSAGKYSSSQKLLLLK